MSPGIFSVPPLVSAILFLGFGAFVWLKSPRSRVNAIFFVLCIGTFIWQCSWAVLFSMDDRQFVMPLIRFTYSAIIFLPILIYHFTTAFLGVETRERFWIKGFYIGGIAFLATIYFPPYLLNGYHEYFFGPYPKANPAVHLPYLGFLSAVLARATYLLSVSVLVPGRIGLAREVGNKRRLVLAAMGIYMFAASDFLVNYGVAFYPFGVIFIVISLGIIGYAVIKYRLLDISTVVHRTALWLGTSSVVVIPSVSVYLVLRSQLDKAGYHGAAIEGLLVVGISLVVLIYARLIQPVVDHWFQRRRYDMYQSIQNLAEGLDAIRGVDEVSEKVIETVTGVLYPERASVAVFSEGKATAWFPRNGPSALPSAGVVRWLATNNEIVRRGQWVTDDRMESVVGDMAEFFDAVGAEVIVPFVKDQTVVGVLHLGPKQTMHPYSALDSDFLNRLRTEVTVAYHNSILFQNVTALSERLESWNTELEQKIQMRTHELEGAYNQLKELDEAKTQFFATVSHELRTPLTLILAPLESILKGEMGPVPDGLQRHVAVMHQNGLRLLKQINNLLDLTKLDAGRMTLQRRPGDLRAFFRGLVASVSPMAEKKHIELGGYEDAPLPRRAFFDPDRLEKVVLNLVFNAIKFTNTGGRVEVRWGRSASGELQVRIKDTGIGIAEKDLPNLFKRFSQVDASTSRRYEGTGIGLALAKEIVELHGGRIGVESEPGQGSTFTFTIPLVLELPQTEITGDTASEPQADDGPSTDWTRELHVAAERQSVGIAQEPVGVSELSLSPSNGRQVLVVEDNADMREFVAFELQGEYRVLKAANGLEGVRMAGEQLPEVIISDVMMPEMDGYQLCREIRKDARTKHIPIILLTARADMAMKIEGLEHGADDYLTKPFNAQELRAKIKSLLEQRRLEREIQQRNEALEAALEELKATQAQLVQSEKMAGLGMLVAGMAHEINNPISFVKNSLAVLQRAWDELKPLLPSQPADPSTGEAVEDVEASLNVVKSGVARTEQIIAQLKTFVRKDQNQKVVCSVQEGLESTLALIRPTIGKQIVIHTDLQSTGHVSAIPGKLNQVWMNLLQNAVQALGTTGDVWVESRDHEHMVTVTVRDSGPGINAEHLARIFEPFFTTKPVGQGTGLGLSVSYRIVQDAGGRIDVKSEPGRGAEFTVVLPLARALSRAA